MGIRSCSLVSVRFLQRVDSTPPRQQPSRGLHSARTEPPAAPHTMSLIRPLAVSTALEQSSLCLSNMNVADMLTPQDVPASPSHSISGSTSADSSSSATSPVTLTSDMLKRGWIAPFLLHLHQMLRRESQKIIRWTEDGIAFQILDKEALTNQILPKYFKNKNFASFQRQLNYFGFRKWSKARAEHPTYSREHFTRDNYSAMSLVKRQSKKSRKRKASDSTDEEDAKRQAVVPAWMNGDRCKPILPRPDADPVALPPQTFQSPVEVPQLVAPGNISPITKMWAAPSIVNPFVLPQTVSLPATGSRIPAISATRKVPSGCKLPSLRELSASGALVSNVSTRPCWLS